MDITEVRITLRNEDKLKAFASITFDDCFVVRGLKVINGSQGYFVSMPSRKRKDGSYQDIAHPINNEMRKEIEDKVLDAFEKEANNPHSSSHTQEEDEANNPHSSSHTQEEDEANNPHSSSHTQEEDEEGDSDSSSEPKQPESSNSE